MEKIYIAIPSDDYFRKKEKQGKPIFKGNKVYCDNNKRKILTYGGLYGN